MNNSLEVLKILEKELFDSKKEILTRLVQDGEDVDSRYEYIVTCEEYSDICKEIESKQSED